MLSVSKSSSFSSGEMPTTTVPDKLRSVEEQFNNQHVVYNVDNYGTVCAMCRHIIGEHSNIFMFCDQRFCSEECRNMAIEATANRRYY
ncbi:hypothetical protein JH06_3654 [Blastocystis sp. subtype 4]|uniref:hypothetical protein n=1 Tax=Blastocystis sp. subtype 4 TaxID=944170 RepID=UPI000711FD19|nr:hypothetical protein JH06_3654 [Blastocystis sp. subtype 4]KNB42693.1 hypothetical protein JH06_3654 [Blastocystis sp. subtype 4]|eukprot:XP_014526136.1 hypothetical protein JH06_3654 [Blastocystis sp. subtype 4]